MDPSDRPSRLARLLLVVTSAVGLVLGLAAMPASAPRAQAQGPSDYDATARWNCNSLMDDEDPRDFIVFTIEDIPNSPFQGGGVTWGFVWVDRRVDGRGYDVCVGWPTGGADDPYAWQARVMDNEPDGHGAIAYMTYEPWYSDNRVRDYIAESRVDGNGNVTGYNALAFGVKDFYMGVCIVKAGRYSGCNDERGVD
jgi:hypothetical protein